MKSDHFFVPYTRMDERFTCRTWKLLEGKTGRSFFDTDLTVFFLDMSLKAKENSAWNRWELHIVKATLSEVISKRKAQARNGEKFATGVKEE